MEKVVDADDVYKVSEKLRKVIPDLFAKRTSGTTMISEVLKYEVEKEKYKDRESYKVLYNTYASSKASLESAMVALMHAKNKLNNNTEITKQMSTLEEKREQFKYALTAMMQNFEDEYKNIYCLGDSLMKSLFRRGTEPSELESGWKVVQDMAVFKCIIYLLFYYANIYDDVYISNSCWEWKDNSDTKIKLFKSFLQSCIDYIDTQEVEIPTITHDEFEWIKQAVQNKNEKCTLKEYFKKLPYVDKLCFYILDRNSISSANVGKDGQLLCPFIGFKRKSSSWKRISKGFTAKGETMKNIIAGPTNKNAIIKQYESIIEEIFDKYVKNYNKLPDIVENEYANETGWKTTNQPFSIKWATADTTNQCRSVFITKFKDSQDNTEFLCYCLLLQEYLKNQSITDHVVLNDYINDTIATLKYTNLDKNMKCNDYNKNVPETGKYILSIILKEHSKSYVNGGKRTNRKYRRIRQTRRLLKTKRASRK